VFNSDGLFVGANWPHSRNGQIGAQRHSTEIKQRGHISRCGLKVTKGPKVQQTSSQTKELKHWYSQVIWLAISFEKKTECGDQAASSEQTENWLNRILIEKKSKIQPENFEFGNFWASADSFYAWWPPHLFPVTGR